MPFEKSVEALLREAMERGEFDHLPGKGQPLDLSAYFDTPEEVRLAYSILKSANILPEEASLLKEIALLKEDLRACAEPVRQRQLAAAIEARLLRYNLLRERRKTGR
ncbi:MAG: DUF1992 domain-containing protein [Anaerolineales bacterium]